MSIKEDIHRLVDEVPESALPEILRRLELLRLAETDPFVRALMNAPIDDEPSTPEEDASDEEGWQEYLRGETRDWDEIQADLPR